MKTCYDIVKTLVRSEKGLKLEEQNQYMFQVAKTSNKIEIKNAIEEIYKVKVASVNTTLMPSKKKRVRQALGYTTPWKKAIVKLKDGNKIEVT